MSNVDEFHAVDQAKIAEMARDAAQSERKRVHLLLHAGHHDQVQRLMIVMQPGTYVRPHYHSRQWEMLILLQGRGELLRFDADGGISDRLEMSPAAPVVQIPAGTPHGFVVLAPDTAVMEVKPGPYQPTEFAGWARPRETRTPRHSCSHLPPAEMPRAKTEANSH
jgi:cupin fold WbuC family metalloprotein